MAVNMLTVACDPTTIQTIAVTCRCGCRFVEKVPKEVHDSSLTVILPCPKCDTVYTLRNKTLSRLKEDTVDRLKQTYTINNQQFDA